MKRLFSILVSVVAVFSLYSCDAELDPIVVYPDVTLASSGMQTVNTITIYDTQEYKLKLSRTEGLSKAAEFDLVIDESLISEYNEVNGYHLELMPASLYALSDTKIAFDKADKDTVVLLNLRPAAVLEEAGSVAAAENYVIPISLVPAKGSTISTDQSNLELMVKFNYDEPIVTIDGSATPTPLTFISGANVTRKLQVTGSANFSTIDMSKISFNPTQEAVDAYNTANGTSYELLAEEFYTIGAGVYDPETSALTFPLDIMASAADPTKTYLLPVVAVCDEYTLRQEVLYYVVVDLQEIKMAVANTDRYVSAIQDAYKIPIEVSVNGVIGIDVPIEFSYDASLIDAYNTAKGKTYKTFDATKITCTPATLSGDATKVTAVMTVDMTAEKFESGNEYVLPFRLDRSKLIEGTQVTTEDIVYVRLKRTLIGMWGNNENGDGIKKSENVDNNEHPWVHPNSMKAQTRAIEAGDGYEYDTVNGGYTYQNWYYVWERGYQWRVLWDTNYVDANGKEYPHRRKVDAFSCVTKGFSTEQQIANIHGQNSYIDLEDGLVYINFRYYWDQTEIDQGKDQYVQAYLTDGLTPAEF